MKARPLLRTPGLWAAFLLIALRLTASSPPKEKTVTLEIQGMVWVMCVDDVRSALESIKGVKKEKLSLEGREAVVTYDPTVVKAEDLVKAIKNAQGMHPNEARVKKKDKWNGAPPQRPQFHRTAGTNRLEPRQINVTSMEQVKKLVQTREAAARKTLVCGFILFGLASAIPIPAHDGAWESRQVKVERKPKLISNGAGQKPFDVTRHAVPLSEIQRSVPKDVIPTLVHPKFVETGQVGKLLDDKDRVLGVFINGEAKAYPVRILNWHELVNDEEGGQPILVSWWPLCGSGVVYDPVIDGRRYTFGISGLLYRRNLLFYDLESGSLWSQLLSEAVTGPLAGKSLKVLPAENTTWGEWKAFHPRTRVLSFETGIQRDYRQDPYAAYPLSRAPALLVIYRGSVKIYPFSELKKETSPLVDSVGGREIRITYDRLTQTAQVENQPAETTAFVAFSDDLKAFYPDAEIYRRRRR